MGIFLWNHLIYFAVFGLGVIALVLLLGLISGLRWAPLVQRTHRPAILNQTHKDWPRILRWIPRSWTAWLGMPPKKWFGNAPLDRPVGLPHLIYPKPIPDAGHWWFGWPLYFSIQTKKGWHFRIGFRYDDVDGYYNFTVQPFKDYD